MGEMVSVTPIDGGASFGVYRAQPMSVPKAAVVFIQEIFGVNAGVRRKCDRLTRRGYLALAPDLFWRIAPGIELDPDQPDRMQRALAFMARFDQGLGVADIEATVRAARIDAAKVGCVGYCLGGRLAFMTAARIDVDASVGYYAVGIPDLLREAHAIAHPLMLHIAGGGSFRQCRGAGPGSRRAGRPCQGHALRLSW